jgi:hypothetical protein
MEHWSILSHPQSFLSEAARCEALVANIDRSCRTRVEEMDTAQRINYASQPLTGSILSTRAM